MAVIYNEYVSSTSDMKQYSERFNASRQSFGTRERMSTVPRRQYLSKSSLGGSRDIAYHQRKGVYIVLILFFFLVFLGVFLGSKTFTFSANRFNSFVTYSAYNPSLPRIQTVLSEFGSVKPIMSINDFMNLQVISGNWGWFEVVRTTLNLIARPFVFAGSLIDNLFSFIGAFLNAFII